LRERREDIPLLVAWFLSKFSVAEGKPVRDVSQEAMQKLINHKWTGNVRELQSAIESAVIGCSGQIIQSTDLPAEINGAINAPRANVPRTSMPMEELVDAKAPHHRGSGANERQSRCCRASFRRQPFDPLQLAARI
jgi:DNA-binding NtrC family response regulator